MSYVKTNWINNVTEVDETNMNHIEDGIEANDIALSNLSTVASTGDYDDLSNKPIISYPTKLLAVSSTAPSQCVEGDMYFNTTTNLIYTATGTNTWGSTGTTPSDDLFYVVFGTDDVIIYVYNGTTLVGVSGGGSLINVVNEHSASTSDVYSANRTNIEIANAVKDIYSTSEVKTNKVWIDGKPIYKKTIVYDSNTPLPNGENAIPHNVSNIGEYRKVESKSFIYEGNTYGGYQSATFNADISSINATNIVVNINGWGNLFKKAFFTIEYTKTTD